MALAFVDHNASVLIVASSRDIAAPVLDYLFDQGVAFVFSRPADLAIGGARLKARYRMAVVLDLDIGERIRESAQLLARQLPCVIVSDGPVFRRDDFRAVLHTDTSPIELFTTIQGVLSERSVGKALTGDTPAMGHVRWLIEQVAQKATPVLLTGEVGVGKAVAAREIHRCSTRRGSLVTVQCAAIGDAGVDAALFGVSPGDGGYLQSAAGGTLVLDEITDLSPLFQARVLQLLKTGSYERPGEASGRPLNARVIATTRRSLNEILDTGELRPDLYYELAVFPIHVPPLRERRDDIEALIDALGAGLPGAMPRFDAQAIIELKRYAWPGNVQELSNLIERLAILYPQTTVGRKTLETYLRPGTKPHTPMRVPEPVIEDSQPADRIATMRLPEDGVDLRELSERLEKQLIEQALARHDHVVAHAARALGLRRTTLTEKLRRYAIRTD